MSALTSIIHPGLYEELDAQGHYPDTGTVQDFTVTRIEGEPTENWSDLASHIDLACAIAALTAREIEQLDKTVAESTHRCAFPDYYGSIAANMRFVVGAHAYLITGVEHDQHATQTYLLLKEIVL